MRTRYLTAFHESRLDIAVDDGAGHARHLAADGPITVQCRWIVLSLASAFLMAIASFAGVYLPGTYAHETPSWAAQGVGQDIVNLLVVLPALLASTYFVAKGSVRGLLVWLGLLVYIVYSYVLYAFFVHFNRLFLVYTAVLGLAFWTLVGTVVNLHPDRLAAAFDRERTYRGQVVYLMGSSLLFVVLWLSDIVPALVSGTAPRDVTEVGLPVNPIHVLDLAFALPAMIVTALSLRKRRLFGLLLAVPLMTFAAVMGTAIVGMSIVMQFRRLAANTDVVVGVCIGLTAIAIGLAYEFLRRVGGR